MTNIASPVPSSDRSDVLDVLRGFAILGIFMANSSGFSLYAFMQDSGKAALPSYPIDHWLEYLTTALIDGKFYSLFSLLFGIGFTIILDRNQKAGRNPLMIFYRRLFILALLGLGHIFLLWEGDILLLYALIGLILPLFRNLENKTLLIVASCLILLPMLFDLATVLSNGAWNPAQPIQALAMKTDAKTGITEENFRTYLVDHDTYQSILNWCRGGIYWRYEYIIGSNRIPKVLAMFLIGYVVGRKIIYANLEANINLLKLVQKWGFIIGILSSIAFAYFMHDNIYLPKPLGLADTLFYALSVIPLSLAYTTSICRMWLKPAWQSKLIILAPVGRMALTNYIMQTLFGIFIYYGIGLGLGGKTGPAIFIPIAIGVFIVQVIYSNIWFRYFKFGPLEWIWRMLTYGKLLPLAK